MTARLELWAGTKGSISTGVLLVCARVAKSSPVGQLGGLFVAVVGVAGTAVVDVLEVARAAFPVSLVPSRKNTMYVHWQATSVEGH